MGAIWYSTPISPIPDTPDTPDTPGTPDTPDTPVIPVYSPSVNSCPGQKLNGGENTENKDLRGRTLPELLWLENQWFELCRITNTTTAKLRLVAIGEEINKRWGVRPKTA